MRKRLRMWKQKGFLVSRGDTASTTQSLWDALDVRYCNPEDVRPRLARLRQTLVPGPQGSASWGVQRNRVARSDFTRYQIEWGTTPAGDGDQDQGGYVVADGHYVGEGFVGALQPGDVIALWVRAQYPGWANHVREASVKVLYDVY